MNTYHYTYLITNLNPTSNEKYYIGVRMTNIKPADDIEYMSSSSYLKSVILAQGIDHFEKVIIAEWGNRTMAELHEKRLHLAHNAAKNPLFYNKKNGVVGFHVTPETTAKAQLKRTETISKTYWKETTGNERIRKYKETVDNPIWKETIGENKNEKLKNTINDTSWKETTGKEQVEKHKATINDPIWKETTGKEQVEKRRETISNPEWKAMQSKKLKEAFNETWKKENTFVCKYCSRSIVGRGNFNRWHNNNCNQKP